MTTRPSASRWTALSCLLARAALDLPPDGRVQVLLPDTLLTLGWLGPARLVAAVHSARCLPLTRRGWTGSAGTWHLAVVVAGEPSQAAARVAEEVVDVARTVLRAGPDDVELVRPAADGTGGLW